MHGSTRFVAYLALTRIWSTLVTPNGGTIIIPFAVGDEIESDLSGGTIKAVTLSVTAPAIVNARAYLKAEPL
jgi:hypothetical protein